MCVTVVLGLGGVVTGVVDVVNVVGVVVAGLCDVVFILLLDTFCDIVAMFVLAGCKIVEVTGEIVDPIKDELGVAVEYIDDKDRGKTGVIVIGTL
jgi:hypothetical protein